MQREQRFFPCRKIYDIGSHFFAVRVKDGSKSYTPESKIVMDLPTAWAFFGLNPTETQSVVQEKVRLLCKSWNEQYAFKRDAVS